MSISIASIYTMVLFDVSMTGFNPQSIKEVKPAGSGVKQKVKISRSKATFRQKLVAGELLLNGGSVKNAMLKAGYSEASTNNPSVVTESKGFIAILDEAGLTDKFLSDALHDDILAKPANRTPELSLAFKVRGRLKDDAQTATFTPATINIAIINPDSLGGALGDTPTPTP